MGKRGRPRRAGGAALGLAAAFLAASILSALSAAAADLPPTLTLLAPTGGEVWSGGTTQPVTWTMWDEEDSLYVTLEYGPEGGGFLPFAEGYRYLGHNTHAWDVPAQDLREVRVRVCAIDFGGKTTCDTSGPFTVDGTPPAVVAASPSGGNVDLAAPILLDFSEPMEPAPTIASIAIAPNPGGLSAVPRNATAFQVDHAPFAPGRTYTVSVSCDATDRSDPGNALAGCPFRFSFTTSAPPSVVVRTPAGGERWTGGSVHVVEWAAWDPEDEVASLAVDLDWSPDGVGWSRLASALPGDGAYAWTVPIVESPTVRIRATVTDTRGLTGEGVSAPFSIDGTAPYVRTHSPQGDGVDVATPIAIDFSEPMDPVRTTSSLSIDPDPGGVVAAMGNATALRIDHAPFAPGTTYTVTVSCEASDVSVPGNPLWRCPFRFSFTTSTQPVVALRTPSGGERWTGGSVHVVEWTAWDLEDPPSALEVRLEWSGDGLAWTFLAGPLPGDASHAWTVPRIEVGTAWIRATVTDTQGLTSSAVSAPFAIDSTPPAVVAALPADGAADVPWTAEVVVTFDDAVAPFGSEAFGLADPLGAWVPGTITWDSPWRVRFSPSVPYRPSTLYTVRLNASIRDASDPGNPMGSTHVSTFSTRPMGLPTIAFTAVPSGVVSGGSVWSIAWTATHPDESADALQVYLDVSEGGPFRPIAGPLPASASLPWTAPGRDVPLGTLRARVVDSQGGTADASATFVVDATPPVVTSKVPAPGAFDVPAITSVSIEFSEPVRASSSAEVGVRERDTGVWLDANVLGVFGTNAVLLTFENPLQELVTYEVLVNGTVTDRSEPGNAAAPSSWTFRIASLPPSVAVLEPRAGVRWTGGASQLLRVAAADAHDPRVTVTAELLVAGGPTFPLLGAQPMDNGEAAFSVPIPAIDVPEGVVRACAADEYGATACASVTVAIDATAPRLLHATPGPNARLVHPDASLVLTFSEPMEVASVEAALSFEGGTPLAFRWTATRAENDTVVVDHARLLEGRTYAVAVGCGARDASSPGLPLGGLCPVVWTFTTASAPQVRLLFPVGGERLTGATAHELRWIAWDDEPAVRTLLELSLDGGQTFAPLSGTATLAVGEGRAAIPVPAVDAAQAVVRIVVRDALDLAATAVSAPFAIDGTPPALLRSTPGDGDPDVSPLEDFVLVFSEAIDVESTKGAVTVTPPLRDASVTWSSTDAPFDTVRISHAAIRLGTPVTIRFEGLRDVSRPGNLVSGSLAFTIAPDRERPVPLILVGVEATEGEVIVLDATASTDNDEIVSYAWTIRDEGGEVLAEPRGARVEYRAGRAGTLNVTVEVADAAGNTASAGALVRVRALGTVVPGAGESVLPPGASLLGLLILAGAGATAFSLTDRGRSWFGRVLFLPLYTKLRSEAVLDQETRGMIRGYVRVHPGDTYTDLKRNLGLANGELAYHLQVLEREGIIRTTTRGSRRVYYPADMPIPEDGGGLHEIQARILKYLEEGPGLTIRDLAGLLGVSSQLTLYHVRKLGEEGYVRFERHGMRLQVFATPEEARRRRERTGAG